MRSWVGLHRYSTWMIVASIVMMAMTVHPSLLAYMLVAINSGWLILTREVARSEGISAPVCIKCVAGGAIILVAAFVVLLKINWLAI